MSGTRVVSAAPNVTARQQYLTGTLLQGSTTLNAPGTNTCSNWTVNTTGTSTGDSSMTSASLFFSGGTTQQCTDTALRLLCLQQ